MNPITVWSEQLAKLQAAMEAAHTAENQRRDEEFRIYLEAIKLKRIRDRRMKIVEDLAGAKQLDLEFILTHQDAIAAFIESLKQLEQ